MRTILRHIFTLISILAFYGVGQAFPTDTYASSSVLSSGRWVKISVKETGLHFIPVSSLRSWGFSDPSKVKIFGYGGARIPDHMTRANYVDDLPPVRSENLANGIVFYAQGPGVWTHGGKDIFTHSLNPYSTRGYYYLTDSQTEADTSIPTEGSGPGENAATTFTERLYHELDLVTPAESGHQLVGEDFRFSPKRTFNFPMPGRVEGTEVWMQCEFFARSTSSAVSLSFSANGSELPSAPGDRVKATPFWGDTCRVRKRFTPEGTNLALSIGISYSSPVTLANLDRLAVTYTRALTLPATGTLVFTSDTRALSLGGAKAETRVWDVTDPNRPIAMPVAASSDASYGWTNDYNGLRTYAAWTTPSTLPAPSLVGVVPNQDIHAAETPDMVIISHPSLLQQSRRIADIHAASPDSLKVLVLSSEEVFNEFGSGSPDVNAMRRMLKMFYDRGLAEGSESRRLKYVLLMGGAHHDHRRLTAAMSSSAALTLPIWQSELCHNESYSYCSDDLLGCLEDNSGFNPENNTLSVAVGRIPARSVGAARTYVDRFEAYVKNPPKSEWRNRVMMFADDGNYGVHMTQTDSTETAIRQTESGRNFTFNKVYIDAYELRNGTSEEAKKKVSTLLNDGVILWTYIGHGAINNLSGDGIFTPGFLNSLYLRNPTFFYGATCTFGQLDGNATSGMESLLLTDEGGIIGGICAVRPVYIALNGPLAITFGDELFRRDENGNFRTVGEVFRRAKNNISYTSDNGNIRRYIFFGDPALRLATPANTIHLTSVGDMAVNEENQPTLEALSRPTVRGEVRDPSGRRIETFNGWISLSLYDAERSFTSFGRGKEGKQVTFDEQGERIYTGRAQVKEGVFETVINMPLEIADNFRPATLSMFAAADDGEEASGVCRDLYVYGLADNVAPDSTAPVIEYIYLNHESFKSSDVVDASPMLIARVSDDVALNLSAAGVGHQMSIRVDDDLNLTDVSSRFTPDDDGSPAGTIHYPLPELEAGNHTATLKVWDTGGNSASATVDFFVNPDLAPKIFDVYSDANPATVEANFFVSHNRPDAMLTVKIEIYDLAGKSIWASETRGKADMYVSTPVTWNLTNRSGSRVNRGIYLYRTTVTSGGESSTLTKRIAVAPQ